MNAKWAAITIERGEVSFLTLHGSLEDARKNHADWIRRRWDKELEDAAGGRLAFSWSPLNDAETIEAWNEEQVGEADPVYLHIRQVDHDLS